MTTYHITFTDGHQGARGTLVALLTQAMLQIPRGVINVHDGTILGETGDVVATFEPKPSIAEMVEATMQTQKDRMNMPFLLHGSIDAKGQAHIDHRSAIYLLRTITPNWKCTVCPKGAKDVSSSAP